MIFLLSPAKTLDFKADTANQLTTTPDHLDHSEQLIQELRQLSNSDVSKLMSLSDKLTELNTQRFSDWTKQHTLSDTCKAAITVFKGDVYQGLDVESWDTKHLETAQDNIRILSGLYGLLRPLDLMQAYRLEMGTKLNNARGKNLYQFWGNIITDSLNQLNTNFFINLASNEYFSAVKKKELNAPLITPIFKDYKNGKYKIISFYAKKARGSMAAWAIKNNIQEASKLQSFSENGYAFSQQDSNDEEYVFLRNVEEL